MNDEEAQKKFIEDSRWNLAKAYLDRADHSANILRSLLFTAAAAAIGFVVYGNKGAELRSHSVPLVLLAAAVVVTFCSWDEQKRKAKAKYDALKAGNDPDAVKGCPNYIFDRIAAVLLAAGAVAEIVILMWER